MKLIFFDEAENDANYEHYHIGGVCIDEEHLSTVEARINNVAQESFGHSRLERGTELHAAEIYHRKKHFKEWADFDRRVKLMDNLIRAYA